MKHNVIETIRIISSRIWCTEQKLHYGMLFSASALKVAYSQKKECNAHSFFVFFCHSLQPLAHLSLRQQAKQRQKEREKKIGVQWG